MKYVIIPILRFLYVAFALSALPVIALLLGAISLWEWDLKHLKYTYTLYAVNFFVQEEEVKDGESYYVYKNPLDYLLRKKTYRIK